jgi:4-azaleucine resistance transporter AzlC
MAERAQIAAAFRATLPVLFGYVPLGAAFGFLFSDLGYPWWLAPLTGLAVYAGSAQFLGVGLLAAQAGLLETAVAVFLLNARHLFYGFSMLGRYPGTGWAKWYLVFGLTDETYALLTSTPVPAKTHPQDFHLAVTALNQCYWVIGCGVGALLGTNLSVDTTGLDFALTALFTVLLIDQIKSATAMYPFAVAAVSGVAALWLLGPDNMLLGALAVSLSVLLIGRRSGLWAS